MSAWLVLFHAHDVVSWCIVIKALPKIISQGDSRTLFESWCNRGIVCSKWKNKLLRKVIPYWPCSHVTSVFALTSQINFTSSWRADGNINIRYEPTLTWRLAMCYLSIFNILWTFHKWKITLVVNSYWSLRLLNFLLILLASLFSISLFEALCVKQSYNAFFTNKNIDAKKLTSTEKFSQLMLTFSKAEKNLQLMHLILRPCITTNKK